MQIAGVFFAFLLYSSQAFPLNDKFDDSFRKWNAYYTPELPWYWLKSQAYIESALNPSAESPVGAKGISQFLDSTWGDMREQLSLTVDQYNADAAIQAQAYYMRQLRSTWTRYGRSQCEIHNLALASYNAGTGNILKAQKESGGEKYWRDLSPHLKKVTGHHSKETIGYVERFWRTVGRILSP
jgi:membrane-bound lytic murein transglycosylase F